MNVLSAHEDLTKPFSRPRKLSLGLEILVAYARVRWWLWRRDLPQTVAALRGSGRARRSSGSDPLTDRLAGIHLGRAVRRALAFLPSDSRCLMRSLVLTSLLARRGVSSSLVIGVRSGPDFGAHAWVESSGSPLLPPIESDYSRLVEI